jgi:hypothetical protein
MEVSETSDLRSIRSETTWLIDNGAQKTPRQLTESFFKHPNSKNYFFALGAGGAEGGMYSGTLLLMGFRDFK